MATRVRLKLSATSPAKGVMAKMTENWMRPMRPSWAAACAGAMVKRAIL